MVMGKKMKVCLGDLFSVNWMEDTDGEDITKESFETQFTKVKKLTSKSHVTQFGDQSINKQFLKDFMTKADALAGTTQAVPEKKKAHSISGQFNHY